MKVVYEKSIDVAYLTLGEDLKKGEITNTYPCDPLPLKNTQITLDFSDNFILRGIEVLDASKHLPKELLDTAEVRE